jgi:hypothetical protein
MFSETSILSTVTRYKFRKGIYNSISMFRLSRQNRVFSVERGCLFVGYNEISCAPEELSVALRIMHSYVRLLYIMGSHIM